MSMVKYKQRGATFTSYKQRPSLLEFLYKKPSMKSPELAEAPGLPEGVMLDAFDDLQGSQKQLREHVAALQARNKELEAFAHMIAHDLKDSLAVMVLTSNLILDIPDLTRQELKEYLQQIGSTAYDMSRIINNLLLFAEVNKVEAPVEFVDMTWIVENVQNRLSHMIKEYRGQINLPEAWPDAIGYAPWIEEVWANYLSNALKHGGRPPRVELGASVQPDGMVRFWARDNGPGILPDAQAHLFIPFSQIGRVCNTGHGLGLSIVLHIVEKLGGQVGFESELGKGSLFFFTLPAGPSSPGINPLPSSSNLAPEKSYPN
jgi:two-component system sensor histidine kinase/response regulator